jgi:enoyl-CoA hydratase/carnithine racemase
MPEFETLLYEEENQVAWVTLNRPEVYNAFNFKMAEELRDLWRGLRFNRDVNCVVLTAAGEKAFCTGIDRADVNPDWADDLAAGKAATGRGNDIGFASPFMQDEPGQFLGPKTNDYWKPVIVALNGMACGGAFFMIGESEFVIAAEHATFFDPHLTYGMPAAFEPIHLLNRAPLPEVMRLALLSNAERLSAKRAHEIGIVSEVVAMDQLHERARWAAETIASYPTVAVQATVRAIWAARDLGHKQALGMSYAFVALGQESEGLKAGQEAFESGRRVPWQLR